jgi:hypothetical protein
MLVNLQLISIKLWFSTNTKSKLRYIFKSRYRFSGKISLIYAFNYNRQNNNIGYVDSNTVTDGLWQDKTESPT